MNLLSLDLSTKTGWSILKDGKLKDCGLIECKPEEFSSLYPENYIQCASEIAGQIMRLSRPDVVVIEETNQAGRFTSRYSQKLLEFIHFAVAARFLDIGIHPQYMDTSKWRRACGVYLSKEHKKKNQAIKTERERIKKDLLSKYLMELRATMPGDGPKAAKLRMKKAQEMATKATGLVSKIKVDGEFTGKVTLKHIAVEQTNRLFGTEFKLKDNDICDAILLGHGYYLTHRSNN